MRDFAKLPPVTPLSAVSAFLAGALFAAIVFAIGFGFWLFILHAALQEAEIRAAKNAMIGISQADRNCIEWQMRHDNAWICVRR